MNKRLIIAGVILGLLIITMVAIPFVFKGNIVKKIKLAANNTINAKVDFSDIELSLFRSFPQLNIRLKNLSVTGTNEFDNIRLLTVGELSTSVNLSSLWKSDGISITSIKLDRPMINLIVNKDGKSNWDIAKATTEPKVTTDKRGKEIDLDKIEIHSATLGYKNESTPMLFSMRNGTFDISGALKGSNSQLAITGKADSISFENNGSRYASNLKAEFKAGFQADFDKISFTLLKNELLINKLPLKAQGTFVLGAKDYNFDLTFKSATSSFGDLLGFLPDKYQKNLKGIETKGDIAFSGFIKGIYSSTTNPGFGVDLKIVGGRLKYPNL